MEALRKLITIIALLFLLFAVLVLVNVISTEYLDSTFTRFSTENYYRTIFGIGAGLLLIYLLISNASILSLKRERLILNNKINELKASLYDKKMDDAREQARENRPLDTNPGLQNPGTPPTNY